MRDRVDESNLGTHRLASHSAYSIRTSYQEVPEQGSTLHLNGIQGQPQTLRLTMTRRKWLAHHRFHLIHIILQLLVIRRTGSSVPERPIQEAPQVLSPNGLRLRASEPSTQELVRIVYFTAYFREQRFPLLHRPERRVDGIALEVSPVPQEEEEE